MKKVLFVTHVGDFLPQFEMERARCLQSMGYEVHYAANFDMLSYGNKIGLLKNSGIICHQLAFARSPLARENFRVLTSLRKLMKEEKFSLIHCHTPVGGALARIAARPFRKQGTKVIYTAHGFHFYKGGSLSGWLIYYPVERLLSLFTDVQVTINEEDYQLARKKFFSPKKVYIPGVGIDSEALMKRQLRDRDSFRRELGLKEGTICLLSVGELDENKNHKLVLDALTSMKGEENWHYLIAGKGCLAKDLERLIRKKELEGRVTLLGYRNDVALVYEAADIFVFPSKREGLSLALMEAMAKGLPVCCSRIRGNRDLVAEGKGGFLAAADRPDQFAGILRKAMSQPEKWQEMGAYNQSQVKAFDRRETCRIMKAVYEEALGSEE